MAKQRLIILPLGDRWNRHILNKLSVAQPVKKLTAFYPEELARGQLEATRFYFSTVLTWSRVSSGSIVSDYGLDDRAIGVRSPAGAKDFSSNLLCPDRLWGPPSLLSNGYRGSFPRG
jgi:hypothetical protein